MIEKRSQNQVFDEVADSYSREIDKSLGKFGVRHDFFTRHKAWLIEDLLARSGFDCAKVALLDVGCGVGSIHGLLEGHLQSITGVDVSPESLRVAASEFPGNTYLHYEGSGLPFADGEFDFAMAVCVFHHIPPAQWEITAREMVRVLRPGGGVLVIEHNPFNPVTRYIVETCPIDEDAVLLRPSRLRELFATAGGSDVVTRSMLSVPPASAPLRWLDRLLGRLPFGAQYYLFARRPG